jgi:hypothetical protein
MSLKHRFVPIDTASGSICADFIFSRRGTIESEAVSCRSSRSEEVELGQRVEMEINAK